MAIQVEYTNSLSHGMEYSIKSIGALSCQFCCLVSIVKKTSFINSDRTLSGNILRKGKLTFRWIKIRLMIVNKSQANTPRNRNLGSRLVCQAVIGCNAHH